MGTTTTRHRLELWVDVCHDDDEEIGPEPTADDVAATLADRLPEALEGCPIDKPAETRGWVSGVQVGAAYPTSRSRSE